jgi:hypothetical protein
MCTQMSLVASALSDLSWNSEHLEPVWDSFFPSILAEYKIQHDAAAAAAADAAAAAFVMEQVPDDDQHAHPTDACGGSNSNSEFEADDLQW